MTNLSEIRRVVVGHSWNDIAEWVHAVEELANLSDGELEAVAAAAPAGTMPRAARCPAS
jgi:hypothetical protein